MGNVRTVRSDRPRLPAPIEKAVLEVGLELRRPVLGDEMFLLALTCLGPGSPSRQVLEDQGVTTEVLRGHTRTGGDGERNPASGFTYAPSYYAMHGRAEAFAAALGEGTITPEHVLLALIWDAGTASSQILWRLGADRQALVETLRLRGVPVPTAALPAQRAVDMGEPVWFDRDQVQAVIEHIRATVPPGTHWGFNYENDRAWAFAESSVDLAGLVAEALPPAIEVRRLDHVQLAMPAGGEDDARGFYAGLLGFTEVPKPERLAGRGGCWFTAGEAKVHLGVEVDFRPARKAHPALLVRGLDALADRLREAGVDITAGDGAGQLYVDDPFGNRVELLDGSGTLPGPP